MTANSHEFVSPSLMVTEKLFFRYYNSSMVDIDSGEIGDMSQVLAFLIEVILGYLFKCLPICKVHFPTAFCLVQKGHLGGGRVKPGGTSA